MKQILLLTDFSNNSKNAINYALQLFENQTCHFFVLHIPTTSVYRTSDLMTVGNKSIYDSLVKKAKQKLDKFVKTLETDSKNENASFESIVDYDVLTDSVNQIIESKKIDIVVMGTNGVTGAKEVVFGSNTINVIRKVDFTTLVIPKGFQYRNPEKILLPLDPFDSLNSPTFLDLHKFAKNHKSSIHILRINPKNETSNEEEKDQESMDNLLKDTVHTYHKISHVPLHYAVDTYLQSHSIDLIALLIQKETTFDRFFLESSTKKLSYSLRVPILIYHTK